MAKWRKNKSRIEMNQLVEALRPYQPECIYLFGSWMRGEEDALSDLDIVVIKHTNKPFFERLREVGRLIPPEMGGVDILVYTPEEFATMRREENAFAEMIAEEARLIYDRKTEN